MKKTIKILLFFTGLVSASLILISFSFSNERSLNWLVSSFTNSMGYKSEINFSSTNWKFYKANIELNKFHISTSHNKFIKFAQAENINLDINFLELLFFRDFLKVKVEKGSLVINQSEKDTKFSPNLFLNYLMNNTNFEAKEINLTGLMAKVDIYDYFSFFLEPEGNSLHSRFQIKDLIIERLNLGPLILYKTSLSMDSYKNGLKFELSNSILEGSVYLKFPINQGLEIELNYINLDPEKVIINSFKELINYLFNNLNFPVSFSVKQLNVNQKDFGIWKFLVYKEKDHLLFDQIEILYKNISILPSEGKGKSNTLSISKDLGETNTFFRGKIASTDLSQSLEIFNETIGITNFSGKQAYLLPDISWKGFPDDFQITDLIGTLEFRFQDLFIKDLGANLTNSSSFFKLISLFNIVDSVGDLTNLNFREKFKSGFASDRVEGLIAIEENKLEIKSPIIFTTGSGKFSWNGYVYRDRNEFTELELELIMTLPLREYLPAYALILGGPITAGAVLIAGKVFKKPLNKLSSGKWKVSGKVNEPNIEFEEWFEN